MINQPFYELREDEVSRALLSVRHDQLLSLRDVAARTGISASTISRIENGHVGEASFTAILALCNCYEVTIDELLTTDFLSEDEEFREDVKVLRDRVVNLEIQLGDLRRKVENAGRAALEETK